MIIENEIWVDVPNYEGLYAVSNMGQIKSMQREWIGGDGAKRSHPEMILSQNEDSIGYLNVNLSKNGKVKGFKVHRLVGICFISNPDKKPFINHKKGIKKDNRATELEWVTAKENTNHAIRNGLIDADKLKQLGINLSKNGLNKMASKLVLDLQTGIFYDSCKEASIAKGFKKKTLSQKLCGSRPNNTTLIYA